MQLEPSLHIPENSLPLEHPSRLAKCQQALEEPFRRIAAAHPGYAWTGDESAVWPLRKAARKSGWSIDEIDAALAASRRRFGMSEGRRDAASVERHFVGVIAAGVLTALVLAEVLRSSSLSKIFGAGVGMTEMGPENEPARAGGRLGLR